MRWVAVMKAHHCPKPSVIVQRFRFHNRFRQPGESVSTYISELRALSEHCGFGLCLDDMLRDRLVCGVKDDAIQRKLLAETDLTLQKASAIAISMETASKDAQILISFGGATVPEKEPESSPRAETIHHVQDKPARKFVGCSCCGKRHPSSICRFKNATCYACGKVGHIKSVCRSRRLETTTKSNQQVNCMQPEEDSTTNTVSEDYEEYTMFNLEKEKKVQPLRASVLIDGNPLSMEVDTGAALSVVSEETWKKLGKDRELEFSDVILRTYSGEVIQVLGKQTVDVQYKDQSYALPIYIVAGSGPALFGRNWMKFIHLDWREMHMIGQLHLESVLEKHSQLFCPDLGTLNGYKVHLYVDKNIKLVFCKPRSVPYAMRSKVNAELDRLVAEGIIEAVPISDWAAPIVPVLKQDKSSVRICGDFRLTVNKAVKLDRYPIPKIEDLFAKLSGGKRFSKLDLSQAYQQLELDEESKQYVVINTQRGLFQYNRLPFGVSSAPGIFQRTLDTVLQGIKNCVVYLDDILVTGSNDEEHLSVLDEVLSRLEKAGLRLQRKKCQFMQTSVKYLGHVMDAHGLHPMPDKVQAIQDAPQPENVSQLKSYLGLLSYYRKFIPNLSTLLTPLYALLKKDVPWSWQESEQHAFETSKQLLQSSQVLMHFDPDLELILSCDASNYGLGAVLSHKLPDGSERPVGFVLYIIYDTVSLINGSELV